MGSIDEISHAIGSIETFQRSLSEAMGRLETRHEAVARDIEELKDETKAHNATVVSLQSQVNEMKPEVDSYTRVRKFAAGIVTGVATVSSAIGAVVMHFVEKKWLS